MGEAQKLPYDELIRRSRDDFDAGTDFTVAVEEEFALLDPETLSLVNRFLPQIVDVRMKKGVNYGCDRIRFPAPVKVGSRIRGKGELVKAEPLEGGVQASIRVTVEIEGQPMPACIADTISRYYF